VTIAIFMSPPDALALSGSPIYLRRSRLQIDEFPKNYR